MSTNINTNINNINDIANMPITLVGISTTIQDITYRQCPACVIQTQLELNAAITSGELTPEEANAITIGGMNLIEISFRLWQCGFCHATYDEVGVKPMKLKRIENKCKCCNMDEDDKKQLGIIVTIV